MSPVIKAASAVESGGIEMKMLFYASDCRLVGRGGSSTSTCERVGVRVP